MSETKTSKAQLRAAQKYREQKIKRTTVDFYPTDYDLWEHVQSQPNKQAYIKGLIRADMEKSTEN